MGFITPYVINGAAHSAALFRRQAQRPASDQAGVSRPGDLLVAPLNVPADGFRVAVGGASIPSRYAGRDRESYGVENSESEIVVTGVTGTGSQGGRRDAVVVEVLDPNYTDITHAEAEPLNYTRIRVVQGVPAGARTVADIPALDGVTAYVLAFIEWPASTGTITAAMIKDARVLANPLYKPVKVSFALSGDAVEAVTSTSGYPAGGQTWPLQAEVAEQLLIDIPEWATHVAAGVKFYGVLYPGGDAWGAVWLRIGANTGVYISSQDSQWDADKTADRTRATLGFADTIAIPASMRGTRQQFRPRALRLGGTNATTARLDRVSSIEMDLMFLQRAV